MTRVLNQVIAIEKGVKSRVMSRIDELDKQLQKNDLVSGIARSYQPKDDGGEQLPPENKKVTLVASLAVAEIAKLTGEYLNVVATKDYANCNAKADIKVDGAVLLAGVPVTHLLFLEKQFVDLQTLVGRVQTLDETEDWSKDANGDTFRSATQATHRTKKVQRPIVLYNATPEHPAQTQLITDDVIVGFWSTQKLSGALQKPVQRAILNKIQKVIDAVKEAREAANSISADDQVAGSKLLDFIFAS